MNKLIALATGLFLANSSFALVNIQEKQLLCESKRHNGVLKVLVTEGTRGKLSGSILYDGEILSKNNRLVENIDRHCCGSNLVTYSTEARGHNQNLPKWELSLDLADNTAELNVHTRKLENKIEDSLLGAVNTFSCEFTNGLNIEDLK